MKWPLRIALGVAGLALLVLVALAFVLPRLAGSAAVRTRIEAAARAALGRDVSFATLEAGFLPPSLRVVDPRIAGASADAPPLLEAEAISLRVGLLPLLTGTLAIDTLVVERATLRLERTREGFVLPRPATAAPDAASPSSESPEADAAADSGSDSALDLALRSVRLRDSTIVLTDRSVSPAVDWELRDVSAEAKGRLLSERIDLEAKASLASGGSLRIDGTSSLGADAELDLEIGLAALALAPLAPYLQDVDSLAGVVTGKLALEGPARDPRSAHVDLELERLDLRRGALRVAGPLRLRAELTQPLGAAAGTFTADATGAEIGLGESFRKPAGTAAEVSGRIAAAPAGGLAVEDLVLALRNLELRGRIARLSPLQLELRSEPFEVDGWHELLPGLATAAPSGRAQLESLAYTAEPQALDGRLKLDGIEVRRADQPPIALRGVLVARGQSLRFEDANLVAGGQEIHVDARVDDLFAAPHYRVSLDAAGTDANQIVSAFAGKPDAIFGLLGMQASFAGPLQGDLLQSVKGRAGFGIEDGRLAGVSLLRTAIDGIGSSGKLALDLGEQFGGRDLKRFYGDSFEALRGSFDVQSGVARTDDLTFVYRGYAVVLRGTLGLADLALDTEGDLRIEAQVDEAIANELGLKDYTPMARTIPLASVGGTLDAPRVQISARTAAALAATYAAPKYADDLRERADELLGEGGSEVVDEGLRVLDNLLGGSRHRDSDEKRKRSDDAAAQDSAPQAPAADSAAAPEAPIQESAPAESAPPQEGVPVQ